MKTLRVLLALGVLMLAATASEKTLAAGYDCRHFSQTNHCSASWDSRAKTCVCQ